MTTGASTDMLVRRLNVAARTSTMGRVPMPRPWHGHEPAAGIGNPVRLILRP